MSIAPRERAPNGSAHTQLAMERAASKRAGSEEVVNETKRSDVEDHASVSKVLSLSDLSAVGMSVETASCLGHYQFSRSSTDQSTCFVSDWSPQTTEGIGKNDFMRAISSQSVANLQDDVVQVVLRSVLSECKFSVTIADPRQQDAPLIAISPAFEEMTGYRSSELIGNNCRALNSGCNLGAQQMLELRRACETGSAFTGILVNKRKNGEYFANLLDLRGLCIGKDKETDKELWFLVGIQADVTDMSDIPEDHLPKLNQVASAIRTKLVDQIGRATVSNAAVEGGGSLSTSHNSIELELAEPGHKGFRRWQLLPTPRWKGSALQNQPWSTAVTVDATADTAIPSVAAETASVRSKPETNQVIIESTWRFQYALVASLPIALGIGAIMLNKAKRRS